jgi:hypothetical protein
MPKLLLLVQSLVNISSRRQVTVPTTGITITVPFTPVDDVKEMLTQSNNSIKIYAIKDKLKFYH